MRFSRFIVLVSALCALILGNVVAPAVASAAETQGSISGRVTAVEGATESAAGGTVYYFRWNPVEQEWRDGGAYVWLDADGFYTWDGLEPGAYKLFYSPSSTRYADVYSGNAHTIEDAAVISVAAGQHVSGIDMTSPAYGSMTARLLISGAPGAAAVPVPNGRAIVWRADPITGVYELVPYGSTTIGSAGFVKDTLLPGRYTVRFLVDPEYGRGAEYYADARYFSEGADIEIAPGEAVDLGDVVLEPRYFDVGRLAGADRFATAVAVSNAMFPEDAAGPVVYIANGYNFPDALAAGPAAVHVGGVILPSAQNALPASIRAELQRLRPSRIVIAGGEAAVGRAVAAEIQAVVGARVEVRRVGGADRYQTAELLVRDAFTGSSPSLVFLATGSGFADALSAGPAAATYDAPVILIDGQAPMSAATKRLIGDLGSSNVVVVGGPAVVGDAAVSGARALVGADRVQRLGGQNRFETSAMLSDYFFDASDYGLLASGYGFADALVGGPLAAAFQSPLLLSQPECIPVEAADVLIDTQVAGVLLLGGDAVLSSRVEQLEVC